MCERQKNCDMNSTWTLSILLCEVLEPLVKTVGIIFSLWHGNRISYEGLQLQQIEILTNGGLIKRHLFLSQNKKSGSRWLLGWVQWLNDVRVAFFTIFQTFFVWEHPLSMEEGEVGGTSHG